MALAASGAEQILKPYGDVHDAYHRIKRERHSFVPHYNAAKRLIATGASCPRRDDLLADLEAAHTAFSRRRADFARLSVDLYEYARPSALPSGRETFHAKMVLADDISCYIGSSNLMGSALERSLECGVVVTGKTAEYCFRLLDAVRGVSQLAHY